jgi:hypothetical protein
MKYTNMICTQTPHALTTTNVYRYIIWTDATERTGTSRTRSKGDSSEARRAEAMQSWELELALGTLDPGQELADGCEKLARGRRVPISPFALPRISPSPNAKRFRL